MAETRKMGKTELVAHFVEHFAAVNISIKRAEAREFFEGAFPISRNSV